MNMERLDMDMFICAITVRVMLVPEVAWSPILRGHVCANPTRRFLEISSVSEPVLDVRANQISRHRCPFAAKLRHLRRQEAGIPPPS